MSNRPRKTEGARPMTRPLAAGLAGSLLWAAIVCAPMGMAWADGATATAPAQAASASVSASTLAGHAVSIKALPTYQDPALLGKAWALPVAAHYRPHIAYQHNASFCGPTSVANVQRSWGGAMDPSSVLDGTGVRTVLGWLPMGLTLDELADVARQKLARRVTVLRGLDLPGFRQHLLMANDPARRYVVNFLREPLFGEGGGHHSPIAGYLVKEDLVLVLDVNSDFGPWLVSPERLLAAMNTLDSSSDKPRGMLLIE